MKNEAPVVYTPAPRDAGAEVVTPASMSKVSLGGSVLASESYQRPSADIIHVTF